MSTVLGAAVAAAPATVPLEARCGAGAGGDGAESGSAGLVVEQGVRAAETGAAADEPRDQRGGDHGAHPTAAPGALGGDHRGRERGGGVRAGGTLGRRGAAPGGPSGAVPGIRGARGLRTRGLRARGVRAGGARHSAVHTPLVVPAAVALLLGHRTPSLRSVGPAAIVTARRRCDIDSLASSLMNPGCVARLGETCDTAGSSASVHRGRAVKCCEVPPSRPDTSARRPLPWCSTRGSSSQRCGRHTGVKPGRTARSWPGERDLRSGSPARTGSEHSDPA